MCECRSVHPASAVWCCTHQRIAAVSVLRMVEPTPTPTGRQSVGRRRRATRRILFGPSSVFRGWPENARRREENRQQWLADSRDKPSEAGVKPGAEIVYRYRQGARRAEASASINVRSAWDAPTPTMYCAASLPGACWAFIIAEMHPLGVGSWARQPLAPGFAPLSPPPRGE